MTESSKLAPIPELEPMTREHREELVGRALAMLRAPTRRDHPTSGSIEWWVIAALTYETMLREAEPHIETFILDACEVSGDPGCLGWPDSHDGPCRMLPNHYAQCTACGNNDVYGELHHDADCPALAAHSRTCNARERPPCRTVNGPV